MKRAIKTHITITKPKRIKILSSKISSELQDDYKKKCSELRIVYIPIKEVPDDYSNISKKN